MGCFHASPLTHLFRKAWRLYPWYLTLPHARWTSSLFVQGTSACSDSVIGDPCTRAVHFSWLKMQFVLWCFLKMHTAGPSQEIPTHWAWLPRHAYLRGSGLERPFPVSNTGLCLLDSLPSQPSPLPSRVLSSQVVTPHLCLRWEEGMGRKAE